MNILFVTWDGPQSTYLEGLFLPIFKKLKKAGYNFCILQFTWANDEILHLRKEACAEAGFSYIPVSVQRRPVALGSFITAITGYRHIRSAIDKHNIDIVLPRSNLPALSTLLALRGRDTRLLFDADGLPLDERIDFTGLSPSSPIYRILRDIESQAVRQADAVITRSHKASEILLARAGSGTSKDKFHVVTNGRNPELFNPGTTKSRASMRISLGIKPDTPLIVYTGSIGPQYCVSEMLRLFGLVLEQRADTHFLALTGSPQLMQDQLISNPNLAKQITIKSVASDEVPAYLACADLGLAFRQPSFSMQAVAPIKLGEYLLCGLPLVATKGIGDTHIINEKVGLIVENMGKEELQGVADWFVEKVLPLREDMRDSCRNIGLKSFSLETSSEKYKEAILKTLEGKHG